VHNVSAGLVVRPNVIRRRLAEELPFMATETILMRAVSRGGDRQHLHERIRRHALAAAEQLKEDSGHNDLADRITGDTSFGLSEDDVHEALDPRRHVGRAPEQVDAFLAEHVVPVLERWGASDQAPELFA
jgi:adenylosuccinate lyase